MAFNQGNGPPPTGYMVNTSIPYIPQSSVYPQSGAVSYYQAGHAIASRDTTAQMAQLSLATGVPPTLQQQQQQQHDPVLNNQTSFQGQFHPMTTVSTNGHFNVNQHPQQQMAMTTMAQNFLPGHQYPSPTSVPQYSPGHVTINASLSPVSPEAHHQAIYSMTAASVLPNRAATEMVAPNAHTAAAFITNSPTQGVPFSAAGAPFYLHSVQVSPPHQPQTQQLFAYSQQQTRSAQPPQTLPLQTAFVNSSDQNQINPNSVAGTATVIGETGEVPYGYMTEYASTDHHSTKTELNALPHSMPTTLNPSLQKRRASSSGELTSPRNDVNNQLMAQHHEARRSSNVLDQMSPRDDPAYQPRNAANFSYEDQTISSDMRYPVISSPMSPRGWADQALPVYEIPTAKDVCLRCLKKVYAMERVGPIKEALYHKNCFTCAVCRSKLNLKNFHHNPNDMDDVNVYCGSHKPKPQNIGSEANAYYIKAGGKGTHQFQADSQPVMAVHYQEHHPPPTDHAVTQARPTNSAEPTNPPAAATPAEPMSPPAAPPTEPSSPAASATSVADNGTQAQMPLRRSASEDKTNSPTTAAAHPSPVTTPTTPTTPQTPPYRRVSAPSTGASSPYSSLSSSSSYAAGLNLKTEPQADNTSLVIEYRNESGSLVRSDRPSSSSSSVTSLEVLESPKRMNGGGIELNQKKVPLITSDCLERRDRPSSNVFPSDNNEIRRGPRNPASRMIKSHSTDEQLSGGNKRMDRPSQND